MCSMSTMRHKHLVPMLVAVIAPGALGVLPQPDAKMAGSARQYIDEQCRSAALSITDQNGSPSSLAGSADRATSDPITLPPRQVIEWHYGPTPGRYIAILVAARANIAIQIRVSVDLRRLPCRLAAWQIVPAGIK